MVSYLVWCTVAAAFFEESFRILVVAGMPLAAIGARIKIRALRDVTRVGGPAAPAHAAVIPLSSLGLKDDEYRVTPRGARLIRVFRLLAIALLIDVVAILVLGENEILMNASVVFVLLLMPGIPWLSREIMREAVRVRAVDRST
jgi:hypothetical protein